MKELFDKLDLASNSKSFSKIACTCANCGRKFDVVLSSSETAEYESGKSLEEIFAKRSSIIRRQAAMGYCDKCFTEFWEVK